MYTFEQKALIASNIENLSRTAFIDTLDEITRHKMEHRSSPGRRFCKETVNEAKVVMYAVTNFYLLEEINQLLGNMLASGIVDQIIRRYVDMRVWNMKIVEKGPSQLSFQHLEGAFTMWMILLAISVLAFFLELFIKTVVRFY